MEVCFKNFRCFKDIGPLKLKKINFLVGENSSGKTSFMAGVNHLTRLCQRRNTGLNTPPFNLGMFDDVMYSQKSKSASRKNSFVYELKLNECRYMYHFTNDNQKIEPSYVSWTHDVGGESSVIDFDVQKKTIQIIANFSDQEVQAFSYFGAGPEWFGHDYCEFGAIVMRDVSALFGNDTGFELLDLGARTTFSILNHFQRKSTAIFSSTAPEALHLNTIALFLNRFFHLFSSEMEKKYLHNVALSPFRSTPRRYYSIEEPGTTSFDPTGANFPVLFERRAHSGIKKFRDIKGKIEVFGAKSGLFKKIEVERLDKRSNYPFSLMVETNSGKRSNIIDVGCGVSQILPLIYELLTVSEPTLFLIQQPEVHLHPRAQAEFASILPLIVSIGCEFLIETHSDFIVDRLRHEIEQGAISNEDVGILFFDNSSKDIQVHQIDLNRKGLPVDPPASYRKFFLDEFDRVCP